MQTVRDVSASLLPVVQAFLDAHLSTGGFLLYTLNRFGPAMVEHRDSGWFVVVEESNRVVGVASATRRGHLLIETGGRADIGDLILDGLGDRIDGIDGVVGEWRAASSVWPSLRRRSAIAVIRETCNLVYVTDLDAKRIVRDTPHTTRLLTAGDFDAWYPLFHALEEQEGVEIHGTRSQLRQGFAVNQWRWHGAFQGTDLVAVACLDISVGGMGHVGGLYVRPSSRRQGFGRAVMLDLMRDTLSDLRLDRLVLYTREDNAPARRLFERLGFSGSGRFAFLLGKRPRERGQA
jgi:ribosomal protein S18 acetylase RimI-like enzyme